MNLPCAEHGPTLDAGNVPGTPRMLVVLQVGPLRLGIDSRRVREVTRAVPLSAPLPGAGAVVGMVTLRGRAAAVIDLGEALGVVRGDRDRRGRMIAVEHDGATACLLVDRIDGLLDVADADLQRPPAAVAAVDVRWLDCVARAANGELIGVVNVDRVLSGASLKKTEAEPVHV